jgi:hypothetical protein
MRFKKSSEGTKHIVGTDFNPSMTKKFAIEIHQRQQNYKNPIIKYSPWFQPRIHNMRKTILRSVVETTGYVYTALK